jgi:hypothetical protein
MLIYVGEVRANYKRTRFNRQFCQIEFAGEPVTCPDFQTEFTRTFQVSAVRCIIYFSSLKYAYMHDALSVSGEAMIFLRAG